ncbi:MAG: 5,6-dimethylbenzimidazole synthase [Alphaproteobacteria bacterium]
MTAPKFDEAFRSRLRELLVWRRDVRRFQKTVPPEGTLEHLIELATLAPSVGLSQPWRFVVVADPARRRAVRENFAECNAAALASYAGERAKLYATLKLEGLDAAPLQLAVFADRSTTQGQALGQRTMPESIEYSAVMAIHTMWLAARALGLGLGWVSILDPARIAALLEVPPEWRFIGYLCIGYAQSDDDVPALERVGWEERRPVENFILRR